MEYEIVVKSTGEIPISFTLNSNERRHARALRELAAIDVNCITVEVMRTARRPVKFAGLEAPAPSAQSAPPAPIKPFGKPATPFLKSVK